jgi:eukaryotic-like serine/threonine-protein kinase
MLGDPAQFERFQRELNVMKTLDHPAVLKGLGSGKFNRIPYLVTEFVDGGSLRAFIETSGPMPSEQAVDLVKKIADGMAYCHKNSVIHRDLKPENILINKDGQPVIMDFGLVLTKDAHRVTYSNLSATMGTPDYMAPEQIEGQRGDQRTDIYALGTIFYELLSGSTPFSGDSNMAVMMQHLKNTAPRIDRAVPSVSLPLAAIVATCLARDPQDRYESMEALIHALENPDQVDLTILDQLESPAEAPSTSMMQMETIRGVLIGAGVLAVLVVLAFFAQYLQR